MTNNNGNIGNVTQSGIVLWEMLTEATLTKQTFYLFFLISVT